jgi:periplasmic protein CpxP/Spy
MRIRRWMTGAAVAAVALFVLAFSPAWAQESPGGQPPEAQGGQAGEHHHAHAMPSPEQRADYLAKQLNLSDDQKGKALAAFQDEQKQMESVHSDSSLSREDRRTKMQQIHENTVSQVKGMLNPDQAKKYEAMQERMHQHEQNGGGSPPPQQPQQ